MSHGVCFTRGHSFLQAQQHRHRAMSGHSCLIRNLPSPAAVFTPPPLPPEIHAAAPDALPLAQGENPPATAPEVPRRHCVVCLMECASHVVTRFCRHNSTGVYRTFFG
ncbi:uncharacterized protein LOC124368968 isoform X1 [Homalodisca vitripennis]|uniref:uncharacterized protein LOC124368968 isoform X1 n=2 Tax=Homalodisca vitripennis TaxID=197043 RepID=UPI001EEC1BB2|nr:uncharacterized protein LOC124368968 isoform X1 [Homalodisca vitripennis]